jgi:hypothetical protein
MAFYRACRFSGQLAAEAASPVGFLPRSVPLGWADKFAGFVDLDMENQPESIAERCACGYLLRSVASGRCPECGRNVTVGDGPPLACYRERRLELRRDFALYPDRLMVLQRN